MPVGLIGKKCGMTRIFNDDGASIPVTVIEVSPNRVTRIIDKKSDGYDAIQVTAGNKKASKLTQAEAGHFKKVGVEPGRILLEFRLADGEESVNVGQELNVTMFKEGQKVDAIGKTIGKGYAGAIKRWNFSSQRNTHGNSLSHRAPGSIGQCQTPGRVFKGKKMAGRLGNERVTIHNLEVVKILEDKNVILIKGAIPGAIDGDVIIRPAVKERGAK